MQGHHWLMLVATVVVGLFIQKYFDPLGKIGIN